MSFGLNSNRKSELALKHAYRLSRHSRETAIFWLPGNSIHAFLESYSQIAQSCWIPGHDGPQADTRQLVRTWLLEHQNWFVIVDDVDHNLFSLSSSSSKYKIRDYIPAPDYGSLLVTTKSREFATSEDVIGEGFRVLDVGPMTDKEAYKLLQRQIPSLDLSDRNDVDELLKVLGNIPSRIVQLAHHVQQKRLTIKQLLSSPDLQHQFQSETKDSFTLSHSKKHMVPFSSKGVPAIDHFVQRVSDMRKLEEYFFPQQPHLTRRKMFVVHGLGGIGKTQLCIEFVRRYQARYSAVFWLDGSSEDALQRSYADTVARLPAGEIPLGLIHATEQASPDRRMIVQGVLNWLALPSNRQWLLVIDNVDHNHAARVRDPLAYDVKQYMPAADHGNIIVTSRLSTLTTPRNSLRLTGVDRDQGRAILEAIGGETMLGMMTAFYNNWSSDRAQVDI
jgi:hypothetical protein